MGKQMSHNLFTIEYVDKISANNNYNIAKATFKNIAKDQFGNPIDLTIFKNVTEDYKNIANYHPFAFDKNPYNNKGDDLFTILQKRGNGSGQQTSFYNSSSFPLQISLQFYGYNIGMDTEKWFIGAYHMLKELLTIDKFDYGFGSKTNNLNVMVVGCGGTGSGIVEKLANIETKSLTIIDNDELEQKNLYRFTLSPNKEDIGKAKVDFINERVGWKTNLIPFKGLFSDWEAQDKKLLPDFVFIAVDNNEARKQVVNFCKSNNIKFVDVGIWAEERKNGSFVWTTRTTTEDETASLEEVSNNDYKKNIQIFSINSLNADIAVIKFQEMCGSLVTDTYNRIEISHGFNFKKE